MSNFVVEQLMSGTLIAALPIALFAGLISFLSPCVLPLVPGYVAYATGFSNSKGKVLLGSTLFVLGFTFVFASYGLAFGGLGSQIAAHEDLITKILGIFTIAMGTIFLGVFPFAPTIAPKISTTGGIAGAHSWKSYSRNGENSPQPYSPLKSATSRMLIPRKLVFVGSAITRIVSSRD
jgi:cytochrome c-type biogenesis protein